jgi:hypothetical protein
VVGDVATTVKLTKGGGQLELDTELVSGPVPLVDGVEQRRHRNLKVPCKAD